MGPEQTSKPPATCEISARLCGWTSSSGVVQVMEEIVQRTASAMVDRGIPFSGVLFAGLMIKDGKVGCPLAVPRRLTGSRPC